MSKEEGVRGEGVENGEGFAEAGAFLKQFVDRNFFKTKPRMVSLSSAGCQAEAFPHRQKNLCDFQVCSFTKPVLWHSTATSNFRLRDDNDPHRRNPVEAQ